MEEKLIVPEEVLMDKIYLIRGLKVMLDSDLAALYEVETKRLKEAVKRNIERFPSDFMFQLSDNELNILRSQIATSRLTHGGDRYLPMVFTEHGVMMLSSVLNSKRAIQVNIQIMRIFTKIRQMLFDNTELRLAIEDLKGQTNNNTKSIDLIFEYLDKFFQKQEREVPIKK